MKENRLISNFNEIDKKIQAISRVLQRLIQDMAKIETLANGTLSSLQIFMGEKEWNKLVKKMKKLEQKTEQQKDKKLEL